MRAGGVVATSVACATDAQIARVFQVDLADGGVAHGVELGAGCCQGRTGCLLDQATGVDTKVAFSAVGAHQVDGTAVPEYDVPGGGSQAGIGGQVGHVQTEVR